MSESDVRERFAREISMVLQYQGLLSTRAIDPTKAIDHPAACVAPILARYRDEVLEEASVEADSCYHGPRDHGCAHGQGIARAIRALKTTI